jgi:peptidoglycan/xylan/chitin deacetylase (PgdA/CDA1 family)
MTADRLDFRSESKSKFDRRALALVYHHIGPSRPGTYRDMTVSPQRFEQQIRWLARHGYVGIKPSEWLHWAREGESLPEKPILVTFDDAYADTADYALPVLRKYGFAGAVFVVTERLGGTNTWDEAKGCGTLQLMTLEQIRYWAGQGIEFGAHSKTHADLTQLSSAECTAEIRGSKSDLAALLNSGVTSFAYPYGSYNNAVRDLARGEFDLAFTAEEGLINLRSDPHLLQRVVVYPDHSLVHFVLIVRTGKSVAGWRVKFGVRTRFRRLLRTLVHPTSERSSR